MGKSKKKSRSGVADLKASSTSTAAQSNSTLSRIWKSSSLITVIVIYFTFSVSLTFYQKSVVSHLRFPFSMVICHLAIKFVLSGSCRWITTVVFKEERVVLSWRDYLYRVSAVAVCSALDIGLSQWSLEYISVALYTITKSTTVLFILLFSLAFRLEKAHWSLLVIVCMICSGLMMFVYHSTSFHLLGFSLAMSGSLMSGARWALAQLVMQRGKLGMEKPIDFIYHLQPFMILTLLPFSWGFEGLSLAASEEVFRYSSVEVVVHTAAIVLVGALLAFCMEVAEFEIVCRSSSLTLSIVGILKEILTITFDVVFRGTHVSSLNIAGVIICLCGIALHVIRKSRSPPESRRGNVRKSHRLLEEDASPGSDKARLLGDSDECDLLSDDEELFLPGDRGSKATSNANKFKEFDDGFYLRETRSWTTVRDRHLEMPASRSGKASPLLSTAGGEDMDSLASVPKILLNPKQIAALEEAEAKRKKHNILADIE